MTDWLENKLGSEILIPVYGHSLFLDSDIIIKSYIIPNDMISQEMETDELNKNADSLLPGFTQYGNDEVVYLRYGNEEGIEPLIVDYYYDDLAEEQVELIEEFKQLFNLFFDRRKNSYIDPHKDNEIVCTIGAKGEFTVINKRYLKSYLAVKGKSLVIFVNAQIQEKIEDKRINSLTIPYESDDNTVIYSVNIGNGDGNNYSLVYGKKLIRGCELED